MGMSNKYMQQLRGSGARCTKVLKLFTLTCHVAAPRFSFKLTLQRMIVDFSDTTNKTMAKP